MMFSIELNGAILVGEADGEGHAVIFLHAGVGDRRMWYAQMADLGDRYHVISYDRRGFGQTEAGNKKFSHSADLLSVYDHFGLETASLVGCSQGGRIAIDFALAYPDKVTSLVLIATAVSGAPVPESFPKQAEILLNELDLAEAMGEGIERINELEAQMWLDGPLSKPKRVKGAVRELFLDMNEIALGHPDLTNEIESLLAWERLREIPVPTAVLWGELDFPHVVERSQKLIEQMPQASGFEIQDVAHMVNLENPEVVTVLIEEFLPQLE